MTREITQFFSDKNYQKTKNIFIITFKQVYINVLLHIYFILYQDDVNISENKIYNRRVPTMLFGYETRKENY